MSRPAAPRTVWRLALLWQGTVLDVVTLKRAKGTLKLRTGETLTVRATGGMLEIEGIGDVEAGVMVDLPAGHTLIATRALPEARVGELSALDSTLFHATMVGAAVQACVVSALVLAPSPTFDRDAGGGSVGEWRRYLVAPGGTAPTRGAPAINMVGRRPEEGERPDPVRTAGHRPRPAAGRQLTVEQALDEMSRVLHLGNDGTELREAIGDIAQAAARAPVSGAEMGGLSPKDPLESGQGNGLIGVGESKLREILHKRISENEKKAQDLLGRSEPRPAIPVQLLDVPQAEVRLAPEEALDPVVKDSLMRAIRQRHNAVRYCYESWGLAADANRTGRLTLELTLLPDGRVKDPNVKVEDDKLRLVAECVAKMAADWYLGDGLVEAPQRLSFPFILTPRKDVKTYDFNDEPLAP